MESLSFHHGIGTLASYHQFEQIGEGTYGFVFRGYHKSNHQQVALKKMIFHKQLHGFPIYALREIKFLKSLKHKNIVSLCDIVTSKGCEHLDDTMQGITLKHNVTEKVKEGKEDEESLREGIKQQLKRVGELYLVFEYIPHDLGGLIDAKYKFSSQAIKFIMKQLFEVLDYLYERKVLHRDIKSSNILITNYHQVKLADFGLARSAVSNDEGEGRFDLTNNVITMWYKPPELLLGSMRYSYGVDMWSVACVMAELELGKPLFPGKSEVDQLEVICKLLGTPTNDNWRESLDLPHYNSMLRNMPRYAANSLRATYSKERLSDQSVDLLDRIFIFDPNRRISAKVALSNRYFTAEPKVPVDATLLEPLNLPEGSSLHEFETKRKRRAEEEMEKTRKELMISDQAVIYPLTVPLPLQGNGTTSPIVLQKNSQSVSS